jgi:hypothetical protein
MASFPASVLSLVLKPIIAISPALSTVCAFDSMNAERAQEKNKVLKSVEIFISKCFENVARLNKIGQQSDE